MIATRRTGTPGHLPGLGRAAGVFALAVFAIRPGVAETVSALPSETDDGIVIGRISVDMQPLGPGVTQREFEQALENTPAYRESARRMAASLAGELSLLDASKLHGQARLDYLEQAARKGDAAAAAAVGDLLDSGDGVTEDATRAFGYFRAAALGGRMDAAHNLGSHYAKGRGTPVDFTEALAWLIIARERGDDSGAELQLRQHLGERGKTAAIECAEQRARLLQVRVTPAEVAAALPEPVAMTFDEARAASDEPADVSPALSEPETPPVVVMTVLGERRTWPTLAALQRSANRGDRAAMGSLGRLLSNGKLLPRDPLAAAVWLERSAALGDVDAAQQLGDLYSNTDGVVRDDAKAFRYFVQAAKGGSLSAVASVGVCHTNGRGTERNLVHGLAWLLAAKHFGLDLGQETRLRAFLNQHRPGDIAQAEALAKTLIESLKPPTR